MKIKLKELNPNPFKKEINKGKLNKEQIEKLKSNIKKLGLMGSIPIFKRDNKYYIVAGHHRVEALKQVYGDSFEIDVDIKNYNEDNIFRGMVVENLTQRSGEYRELKENIVAIRKYLKEHKEILEGLRESRQPSKFSNIKSFEQPTAQDIVKWLDDASNKVIEHDEVTNLLNINDNLAPELEKTVVKKHDKTKEERGDESLNYTQAIILSRIENKEEQKDLAEALKRTPEQRVREQGKLVSQYKEATEETKEKVRSGEIDLTDIPLENLKNNIKKKIDEQKTKDKGKIIITHFKKYERDAGSRIGKTNSEIMQTCAFLNGLENSGVIYDLDWKTMLKILEAMPTAGKGYAKFGEKLIERIK